MALEVIKILNDTAPKAARSTLRYLLFLVGIGVAALFMEHAADAHILRKTRPLRIRLGEQDAVLNHMFDDIEDQRDASHLKRHSLEDVRKKGRKEALQAEREDQAGD